MRLEQVSKLTDVRLDYVVKFCGNSKNNIVLVLEVPNLHVTKGTEQNLMVSACITRLTAWMCIYCVLYDSVK